MVRYSTILILFLCLWVFVPPGACDFHPGYTVEPVTPDMDLGTPLETVPVEFWDLPPGMILLALALSASSIIGLPVELLFFVKVCAFLGYRKVTRIGLFNNELRCRVYSCIRDNPGISPTALVRLTGIKRGTLRYHLIILRLAGKITAPDTPGNPRYFEHAKSIPGLEKTVLKYVRNKTDSRILRLLMQNPDVTRKEIGRHLGLSLSTVSWRMKRLCDESLIRIEKHGKNVHYGITPEARLCLERYLLPDHAAVQGTVLVPAPESA